MSGCTGRTLTKGWRPPRWPWDRRQGQREGRGQTRSRDWAVGTARGLSSGLWPDLLLEKDWLLGEERSRGGECARAGALDVLAPAASQRVLGASE